MEMKKMRSYPVRLIKATALSAAVAASLAVSTACGSVSTGSSTVITAPAAVTTTTTAITSTSTTTSVTTTIQQTTAQEPATAPDIITNTPDNVKPPSQITDGTESTTLPKGQSMNSSFYQDRLFVTGDSICHGFNVFGFVPEAHCLTQASVSMWNLDYFTFDDPAYGVYGLGLVDAVAGVQPKLLYMSLGMNDVNMNDPSGFAEKYVTTAKQIIERVPDVNIVIAGITPIDANVTNFTTNEIIRNFNTQLKNAIDKEDSRRIYYFDAYSVIADPNTLNMRAGGTSGDGIHLSTECYTDFLNSLYSFLDKTSIMAQIKDAESKA
jgi:hypothetical protein